MRTETTSTTHRAFLMTLDPLHIGSGGYRLSRVDLPIIREPATKLPKIPGTSLSGAARSNAAVRLHGRGWKDESGKLHEGVRCAGQRNHCGKCAVCLTFGSMSKSSRKDAGKESLPEDIAWAGMVNFFDARLTLFPVASMMGPVWITSREALLDARFGSVPAEPQGERALVTRDWPLGRLNLGWILLDTSKAAALTLESPVGAAWEAIKDRLVIVPSWLFSQIVNMNLEVRTSVSIDSKTGAAKDGALFTYEAIPRGAWLNLELAENRYRLLPKDDGNNLGNIWRTPLQVAWDGLAAAEHLGIGGMGTRGFGRVRLLGTRPNGGVS